jgi:hypothetical protein
MALIHCLYIISRHSASGMVSQWGTLPKFPRLPPGHLGERVGGPLPFPRVRLTKRRIALLSANLVDQNP